MLVTTTSRFYGTTLPYRLHTSATITKLLPLLVPQSYLLILLLCHADASASDIVLTAFFLGACFQVLAVPALRAGAGATPDVNRQRGRTLLGATAAAAKA